jgi:hypothetical protein
LGYAVTHLRSLAFGFGLGVLVGAYPSVGVTMVYRGQLGVGFAGALAGASLVLFGISITDRQDDGDDADIRFFGPFLLAGIVLGALAAGIGAAVHGSVSLVAFFIGALVGLLMHGVPAILSRESSGRSRVATEVRTTNYRSNVVASMLLKAAARMVPEPEGTLRYAEWESELEALTGGRPTAVRFGLQLLLAGIRLRAAAWSSAVTRGER